MPDYTPKLNLPKPLGNENVNRAAHNELVDAIDANAAPNIHASRHATGGADTLTPAQIGAETQAALNSHVNATDNPHGVTSEQVTVLSSRIDADVDGSEYPLGLTMMDVTVDSGYPGRGVVLNVKRTSNRFGQLFIASQLDGGGMQWRDWHTNGWSEWKESWSNTNNVFEHTGSTNTTGSGYQILASGLIIQFVSYGELHEGTWHGGMLEVFPIAFPNQVLAVLPFYGAKNSNEATNNVLGYRDLTLSSVVLQEGAGGYNRRGGYVAIGR